MKDDLQKGIVLAGLFFVWCGFSIASPLSSPEDQRIFSDKTKLKIKPEIQHLQVARYFTYILKMNHLKKLSIDEPNSVLFLKNYVDELDPRKMLLTSKEVEEINGIKEDVPKLLKTGMLLPLYQVYQRVNQRQEDKLKYFLSKLNSNVKTWSVQELKSQQDWSKNTMSLESRWKQQLSNEYQKLSTYYGPEKTNQVLMQRYEIDLSNLKSKTSTDVFSAIAHSLVRVADPHSSFFAPLAIESGDKQAMEFSKVGIGSVLIKEGVYCVVSSLVANGPAAKSGVIEPGDRILSIKQEGQEKVEVVGWGLENIVQLIRGAPKSQLTLTIQKKKNNEIVEATLVRDYVKISYPKTEHEIVEFDSKKLAIISVPKFYSDHSASLSGSKNAASTSNDMVEILTQINSQNIDGILIDLTDNGGGTLNQGVQSAGIFLGEKPILQQRNSNNKISVVNATQSKLNFEKPIVILVNSATAGSAEIFAGALQDYGRAVVVGQETYGLGTIQRLFDISTITRVKNSGTLKLTVEEYARVSGKPIQQVGIIPDIVLSSGKEKVQREVDLNHSIKPFEFEKIEYDAEDLSKIITLLNNKHQQRVGKNEKQTTNQSQAINILSDLIVE